VHVPWITRHSWFPEVALARSHPATERTRPRGEEATPTYCYHDEGHGLRRTANDRAGASASHRFHRADSLRDSMYVSCLTPSTPRARTCAFDANQRRDHPRPRCWIPWWLSRKADPSERVKTIPGMPQNFLACDREQELLLPPSLRDWLPEDHLAWFVIEAVGELDLAVFFAAYRADGHGRAAHGPAMVVALIVYAYAIGGARRGGSSGVVARTSRAG
jgi:hypothetical protein